MSDVAARVKRILVDHLDTDPEKITDEAHFVEDLGADSLDLVELIMAFEEEFDIEIPDDEADKATTVNKAVELITTKLGEAP